MRIPFWSLLLAAALGCGSRGGAPAGVAPVEPPGVAAGAPLARITAAAPAGDVARVVAASNDLGLELYRAVAGQGGNTVLSPSSISLALSMIYAGAGGDTRAAFEEVLGAGLAEPAYHRAMNGLERQLASRDGADTRLEIVNQAFAQDGLAAQPAFLATLAQEYGAGLRLLEFLEAADLSRRAINGWVSERTEGLVPELFSPDAIDASTRFVLVNALLFEGAWSEGFDPARTRAAGFTCLDGSSAQVQMMWSEKAFARTATLDGVTVAALPYRGGRLSLVILMPDAGTFPAFEAGLTAARLDGYVAALGTSRRNLGLPRFTIRTDADLIPSLADAGLGIAFGPSADFSRLASDPLAITAVVHDATIRVDETGTVAAAATGGSVGVSGPLSVVVDRPFVFLVRDDATGAVLFLGRMVGP